jgi:hypothetical protein
MNELENDPLEHGIFFWFATFGAAASAIVLWWANI